MHLYNTLSRKKEQFTPIQPPQVLMYCCGPTVYDFLHIGNFRGAVVYNCLRLWLERLGFKVRYIYNLTDIDDKIIQKAKQEQTDSKQIAEKYISQFFKDFQALKLKPHDANPKATEFIPQMIELIEKLIQSQKAYSKGGDVFYRVKEFKKYGKLSRRNLDDLLSHTRDELEAGDKEYPLDFALWKSSKPGEPSWPSPWGQGRPGWHIECTSMIHSVLSQHIDIHGGGIDLIFPHHENELAQAEGLKPAPFVKYWVHHNMFELKGSKISKSLGNTKTMHEFLKEYNGEIFKHITLSSHYRSTSEVSQNVIYQSIAALFRIYKALSTAQAITRSTQKSCSNIFSKTIFLENLRGFRAQFAEALNNDLNTAKALAVCFSFVRFFNEKIPPLAAQKGFSEEDQEMATLFLEFFKEYGQILSLFQEDPHPFLKELDDILLRKTSLTRNMVDEWIAKRILLRKEKQFLKADEIRNQLNKQGVELQDVKTADGGVQTLWNMDPAFFLKHK